MMVKSFPFPSRTIICSGICEPEPLRSHGPSPGPRGVTRWSTWGSSIAFFMISVGMATWHNSGQWDMWGDLLGTPPKFPLLLKKSYEGRSGLFLPLDIKVSKWDTWSSSSHLTSHLRWSQHGWCHWATGLSTTIPSYVLM